MSKTVKLYNVAIYKNDEKTDNSFLKFIDKISLIKDRENVVRKINGKASAIFPFHFSSNKNMRIIPLGKFRSNYKPFLGDIETTSLELIKKDVVEIVTMVYDETYKTVMIEFNIHGLKERDIEEYLSSFMKQSAEDKWKVVFTPIISYNKKSDLDTSKQIKSMEIKLKLDRMTKKLIDSHTQVDEKSIISFFDSLANNAKSEIDANILKLEFGVGLKKTATLNLDGIKLMFNALNISDDCIDSVIVKYKNSKNQKINTINLKKFDTQLSVKVLNNSDNENPASEQIGNAIIDEYSSYESTVLDSCMVFNEDVKQLGEYKFKSIPNEIYKVEVKKE